MNFVLLVACRCSGTACVNLNRVKCDASSMGVPAHDDTSADMSSGATMSSVSTQTGVLSVQLSRGSRSWAEAQRAPL